MLKRATVISILLAVMATAGAAGALGPAPATIGFGIAVPAALPIDWNASFSFLAFEALASSNLTFAVEIGTYPATFPDVFEGSVHLLVKAWVGAASVLGGGGLTVQYRRVGDAWAIRPLLGLRVGWQFWPIDAFSVSSHVRSLDTLPASWSLRPEIACGLNIGLGRARPGAPRIDGEHLWILVALATAALIAFLPKK